MARTITVKGVGSACAKPNYVVLSMSLEAEHRDYQTAMDMAAAQIRQLNQSLGGVGFEKEDLKTTDFQVDTVYDREKDRNGNYKSIFRGYAVNHRLKLGFDFDMGVLAQTLCAVAGCLAHPQLSVAFTVKDAAALNEELLRSATENARRKAQVLCQASGVKLGELVAIDYNWGELNIYSHTRYDCCNEVMANTCAIDIEPEDIDVRDTATFVWQIG